MSKDNENSQILKKQELIRMLLNKKRKIIEQDTKTTIQQRYPTDILSLSFAQEQIWNLEQIFPENIAYNIPRAFLVHGDLKLWALTQSFHAIAQRHEILRTNFLFKDSKLQQYIASSSALSLPVIDLSGLDQEKQRLETQQVITRAIKQPFNLSQDVLTRLYLLRISAQEHILLLNRHHIITDGWLEGLLLRELIIFYEMHTRGKSSSLPSLPIQYADYALWQKKKLQGEYLEQQITYWKTQLNGPLPTLNLPTNRPRPAIQTFHGARQTIILAKPLVKTLTALGEQTSTTLFMILLAAFQTLLSHYSRLDDILVGTPVANRTMKEVEHLIGYFVNTLVMRTDLSGDPTFLDLLQRVRSISINAYNNQDVPFEFLVRHLQLKRDLMQNPLFQAMFVFHNFPDPDLKMDDVSFRRLDIHNGTAKFDILLEMKYIEEDLYGILEYNTDLFDGTMISRFLAHLQQLLENIVAHPQKHLSEISILSATDYQMQLYDWNATYRAYNFCPVHHLITQQVAQRPDTIAIVFDDTKEFYDDQIRSIAQRYCNIINEMINNPSYLHENYTVRSDRISHLSFQDKQALLTRLLTKKKKILNNNDDVIA